MDRIGVKTGPRINHYLEDYQKVQFEFFQFMNGQIEMIIVHKKRKAIVQFVNIEDFTKRATGEGLPDQYIKLISRILS